ncbi:Tfp pilus assembly protein FimT/FimU [Psychrobacter immobilis]|uniref:pilus assembly FimT family protein n=1 Tax=Psychrobacter immobilis TaxID=498 RepID=UPI001D12DAFF|nr:prepilin-type N-terminal cleavage/methylation domain-containing protein [Psychrobacter immobilis]
MNASANTVVQKLRMTSSGFTLIELMVTIAVLAIIVSIAAPNISNQLANQRVKSTTATLENALKEAKAESIIRRQPLTLSFDNTKKTIKIDYMVSGAVKKNIASYKYDTKSTIKPNATSTKFSPNKIANATIYTICDSNTAATPLKVTVSAIATISVKSEGTCT